MDDLGFYIFHLRSVRFHPVGISISESLACLLLEEMS